MEIISNLVIQLIFTVGVVAGFGLLIALCRYVFCKTAGRAGAAVLLVTGAVGTPIHELSHALACLLFGHKVTEIRLYNPGAEDGTLGYVNHTYNPRNIYHQIGNFFIGVAPIICGCGVIFLLMYLLVPDVYSAVAGELGTIGELPKDFYDNALYAGYFDIFVNIILHIFDLGNMSSFLWWIFILLALMIAGHMELSFADVKSGFKGFLFIFGGLLAVDVVLCFISSELLFGLTSVMTSFSLYIAGFLAISLVFLVAMVAIAALIKMLLRIIF